MLKNPLVSIIIPSYNAGQWVGEAIDSCLAQTYEQIEIVVVDDGSTDESVRTLQDYGNCITLQVEPVNRGGNHARNRGFVLSRGEYVQFLDADDYLLPEKIARQVRFLEGTGADVVYGDWRHQFHEPDGRFWQDDIHVAGEQPDVLASLLAGWWVANNAILWRRRAVAAGGGWDESIQAGQDRDFFLSVAMAGATIGYQPGCHAIYRRHGNETVSTGNTRRWLDNHVRLLDKAKRTLDESGRLNDVYKQALAQSYFHCVRNYYERDREKHRQLYQEVLRLDPDFRPDESAVYNLAYRYLGFLQAEKLAGYLRRMRTRHG